MSREVRRVPLGWKHPVKFNPYWESQRRSFGGGIRPVSRLHAPTERFVGLIGDYPEALDRWESDLADARERTGHSWKFNVEYHLTGWQRRDGDPLVVHPWYGYEADGETETTTPVRDMDHLQRLLIARVEGERPDPSYYMPVFDGPADEMGWCLYETVSEGTPTTPVFATAGELIDHLATVGQDYDQIPMRRAAAEALVTTGWSMGSFVVAGGKLYNSSEDADRLSEALGGSS